MDYDMDNLLDVGNFEDFADDDALPPTVGIDVLEATPYLERSQSYWMQVPLPNHIAPTGGNPLAALSDEVLLSMSPTLVMHVQRTAAMGGFQIISPRATSLAASMARTDHARRTTDMFLVGSIASRNTEWPTIDGDPMTTLFPNHPVDAFPSQLAARHRVKTVGVMSSADKSGDPVLKSYLTGRAIVDLQRRTDVAGSGDLVGRALASAWGVPHWEYEAEAEATLAPQGDLLRYAIRADEAYPLLNAPVEAKKCISVGANTAGRELYGEFCAIDWRRLRVGVESVYYMSVRTEGHSLVDMSLDEPPGDPRASVTRPGILQFRPMPGSVWTYSPDTFRIDPPNSGVVQSAVTLPDRVSQAIRTFYRDARPIALAVASGMPLNLVPTSNAEPSTRTREALVAGYTTVIKLATTHAPRGKTAAAAVRDFLYNVLSATSTLSGVSTIWVARYLAETANQCGMGYLVDFHLVRLLAGRLSEHMGDIRLKIAAEAARHSEDIDTWWAALSASLPAELKERPENTSAWAVATAYYLLFPYSAKWSGLRTAMALRSQRVLPIIRSSSVRLPAALGSRERVVEAAAADTRALGAAYGAYYGAMREVCEILAAQCLRYGNAMSSHRFTTAGMLWDIRAKATSSVKFHTEDDTRETAGRYVGRTGAYHITVAPYNAYRRWYEHIHRSRFVSRTAKEAFPDHITGTVSATFRGKTTALYHMGHEANVRAFRYVANPSVLADDMERTLADLMTDITATIQRYENEVPLSDWGTWEREPVAELVSPVDIMRLKPAATSYWALLLTLEQGLAVAIEEDVSSAPPDIRDAIEGGSYADTAALLAAYRELVAPAAGKGKTEAIH